MENKLWKSKGIHQIKHLLDDAGLFLNKDELEFRHNIVCSILFYNNIKSCIPMQWKPFLKSNNNTKNVIDNPHDQISIKIGEKDKKKLNK